MNKTIKRKWDDCGRDDLRAIPMMIEKGWTIKFNPDDVRSGRTAPDNTPVYDVQFVSLFETIWTVVDRNTGMLVWMRAWLENGSYTGHTRHDSCADALNRIETKNQ